MQNLTGGKNTGGEITLKIKFIFTLYTVYANVYFVLAYDL